MSLSPEQIQYQEDHASDTAIPRLIAVFIVCFVISYVGITFRFVSRRLSRTKLGADDWLMLLSGVSRVVPGYALLLSLILDYTALYDRFPFIKCSSDTSRSWTACHSHPKPRKLCFGMQSVGHATSANSRP